MDCVRADAYEINKESYVGKGKNRDGEHPLLLIVVKIGCGIHTTATKKKKKGLVVGKR